MKRYKLLILLSLSCIFLMTSCMHDPLGGSNPDIVDPVDTTNNMQGIPCSTDTVYFVNQILPIIQSNCARSGCHGNGSAQDGVDLTSYNKIINTADVRPFNVSGSDLYEVITENNVNKRMPPPPSNALTAEQKDLIRKWIQQGAKNNSCSSCDNTNVTFSGKVFPIIKNNCTGCHSGQQPQGNISLTNYNEIKVQADAGRLYGAVSHASGYVAMPYSQPKLNQCLIDQIKTWIDDGALNN